MKKSLLWIVVMVLSVSMLATFSLAGCKEEAAVEEVPEAVEEVEVEEEVVEEEVVEEEVEVEEEERDYYYWDEVQTAAELESLRKVVREDAVPIAVDVDEVKIALIFPAEDLSDSWLRGHIGMEERLKELQIPYEIITMGSRHDDHTIQRDHLERALVEKYDYVIVGPTEIYVQADAIEQLIADPDIQVIVWNYTTPLMQWGKTRAEGQPLAYVGFCHYGGAQVLGQYILETYDFKNVAHIHGIPGATSIQRGHTVRDMLIEAGINIVYETYCDWDMDKAYEATEMILTAYPEVEHIHIISTDMASGAAAAIEEMGMTGEVVINGWGGGSKEQDLLLAGQLDFTVLRNQDDWGVSLAEIIKLDLEGLRDEIPLVFNGEMTLIDKTFDRAAIDEILEYAFRYSGVLEIK